MRTEVSVSGQDEVEQFSPGGPLFLELELSVFVWQTDSCTATTQLVTAFTTTGYTHTSLSSARFDVELPLFDAAGNPAGVVDVDLELSGTGPVTVGHDQIHEEFPGAEGTHFTNHGNHSRSRQATASGSVTVNGLEVIGGFTVGVLGETTARQVRLETDRTL
jgi:hypothetical protein